MAKKQDQKKNAKNVQKGNEKKASDKTFGLKNKNRSSVVKRQVEQVESQVVTAAQKKKQAERERLALEKKAAEAAKAEARALFSRAVNPTQKVDVGVDPKSVVCAFFKQGLCSKGARCKFSHDLAVERKGEKRDLYSDEREDKNTDTMDKWDDKKLQEVILSKHGNPKTTTDKICKFFIEAVENGKYGWFWICPNGGDTCKYRHSLPPGFKLKTKEEQRLERQAAAATPVVTLEEFIETELASLSKQRTPITFESFNKWKAEREAKKSKSAEEAAKNKKTPLSGRQLMLSGKFSNNEETDDMDVWDLDAMRRETEKEKEAADRELQARQQQTPAIAV